jgi:hypothetical protein
LMDDGRNVSSFICVSRFLKFCILRHDMFYIISLQFVSGTIVYWLTSPNQTVSVMDALQHSVLFDRNRLNDSKVTPFFVGISRWTSQTMQTQTVLIGAKSSQYHFVGSYVQLVASFNCRPGFYVNISQDILENTTKSYEFLMTRSLNTDICSRCVLGTYSLPDTTGRCPNCTAGTFSNLNNTECIFCPNNTWSIAGSASCQTCETNTTTRERDHCTTLKFLTPPPQSVVSGIANTLPAIALVDVFGSVLLQRSGIVQVRLQCTPPACFTDLNAAFDLITMSIEVVNGSTSVAQFVFIDNNQIKVGTGFIWRVFTLQDFGAFGHSIPILDIAMSSYPVMFLGASPFIQNVLPTQIASVGKTQLTITSVWNLIPRISDAFVNESAFCVFRFSRKISMNSSDPTSSTLSGNESASVESLLFLEVRSPISDLSDASFKTCATPPIPEFSLANISIVFRDGRRSSNAFVLESVCHHNFYVINGSKCHECPVSSTGSSTNSLINAHSVQSCVCSAGSYGSFGDKCRFCPKPSSLPSPPFICNISNLQYPIVAPGYWVDYSLLSRCEATSATCIAVTTCAFGPRACPGGGEKLCTQTELECYEGKGCTNCCPLFYNENSACFKCPDSSQTTALLAVVALVCFILAVLMSSVSSPQFTQSSKYR